MCLFCVLALAAAVFVAVRVMFHIEQSQVVLLVMKQCLHRSSNAQFLAGKQVERAELAEFSDGAFAVLEVLTHAVATNRALHGVSSGDERRRRQKAPFGLHAKFSTQTKETTEKNEDGP